MHHSNMILIILMIFVEKRYNMTECKKVKRFINEITFVPNTQAAVAKGYSDALVRRRSWVQFPSAAP